MAHKNLLKGMKRPRSIAIEHDEESKFFGRIIASPLERGYGTTLGNTLRRTLLSALNGHTLQCKLAAFVIDDHAIEFILKATV